MFKLTHVIPPKAAVLAAFLALAACATTPTSPKEVPALSGKEKNLLKLAQASEHGRDVSQSVRLYRQAINMSQGNVDAHMALANLYDRKGMREEALSVMQEAKSLQPTHPVVNKQLGHYYAKQGNGTKALTYFEDGLRGEPSDSELLAGKGIALDILSRHKEAQASYVKALGQAGAAREVIYNDLAVSHLMTGEYDKAITFLNTIEPKGKAVRKNLSIAYKLKGDAGKSNEWRGDVVSEGSIARSAAFYRDYVRNRSKTK